MESLLLESLRVNAPILLVVAFGFWRVVSALHKIDRRLVHVETLIHPDKEPKED